LLLLVSCHQENENAYSKMGNQHIIDDALAFEEDIEIEPPRSAEPPSPTSNSVIKKGSKIIKSGTMKFEVDALELAKSKVDALLKTSNGYYELEKFNSYGNRDSYVLRLRIPNAKFDSLITKIESGVGKLKSKSINAKDVTEEYVDINIRLENNLAYLAQYQEILKKARTVKEILEVQEKIRRIEEEINSKKGRIKFLDDQVSYSTLNLELTKLVSTNISDKPNIITRLFNAFNNGVNSFLSFIIGLVNLWPFLILILFIFLGRKKIINRIRKKIQKK